MARDLGEERDLGEIEMSECMYVYKIERRREKY